MTHAAEEVQDGAFVRQPDAFKGWLPDDAEPDRYHLYVSWACPWAHRIILVRRLLGLEDVLGMTAVDPIRDERGWAFPTPDPVNGFHFLAEAYHAADPAFKPGRYTVPVLWDKVERRIVSNDDDDLMRMLPRAFARHAHGPDLFPAAHREEIERLNAWLYPRVNNGVYRAGFADTQAAYDQAVGEVFAALDELDARLATRRYLVTSHPVETDWRLFTTLVRFDAVYVGHFKCNVRRIVDYAALSGYMRDLYQLPGVAETVKIDEIKRHYYITHPDINPTRIVPAGPLLDFMAPHGREALP